MGMFYMDEMSGLRCPRCSSDVLYRYGKVLSGKQRYLCLMCQKQFVEGSARVFVKDRPSCPKCDNPMHLYMRGPEILRFRCSRYPFCRTYKKIHLKEADA
jgi:ssDNA-binding Zn-finger/Zn-ribbon topoisomerase 1